MKTFLLGFFSIVLFVSHLQEPNTKTITATYIGYDEAVYSFYDDNENNYDFQKIEPDVLKAFNLKSEDFLDKKFKITYKSEKSQDENEEQTEILTIIKLELVKE